MIEEGIKEFGTGSQRFLVGIGVLRMYEIIVRANSMFEAKVFIEKDLIECFKGDPMYTRIKGVEASIISRLPDK